MRGGLIDLFPMGSTVPYRVDLFDDEIDSIRTFDPDSQRSLYPVPEVRLLPGREFPMDDDARARFRSRWRELLEGDPTKSRIYKDIGNGVATAGIEYYLPLFFDETATVFDYLGARRHGGAARRPGAGLPALLAGHARPLPAGAGRPRPAGAAAGNIVSHRRAVLWPRQRASRSWRCAPAASQDVAAPTREFEALPPWPWCAAPRSRWRGSRRTLQASPQRVLLLAESDGRRESLLDFLRASHLSPPAFDSLAEFQASDEKLGIATAPLAIGFGWLEDGIDFVTETELFAAGPTTRRRKKQEQVSDVEALIKDLSELNVGDPVVHTQHGIGRYRGLVNLDLGQGRTRTARPRCRNSCTSNTPTRPRCMCR